MCAQKTALDTRTKLQLKIPIRSTITAIHKFQEERIFWKARETLVKHPLALVYTDQAFWTTCALSVSINGKIAILSVR